jgi:hypothetical protein
MTIPGWLRQTLIDDGVLSADRVERRARLTRCRRCRQPILVGLDADICAFPARVDPFPVDEIGELKALASERPTYQVHETIGRVELDYRTQWHVAGTPPTRCVVFAEHECGNVLGRIQNLEMSKLKAREDACPF